MTVPSTTCDVCGVVKKESNHWFQLLYVPAEDRITVFLGTYPGRNTKDICGEDCLMKELSSYMKEYRKANATEDSSNR